LLTSSFLSRQIKSIFFKKIKKNKGFCLWQVGGLGDAGAEVTRIRSANTKHSTVAAALIFGLGALMFVQEAFTLALGAACWYSVIFGWFIINRHRSSSNNLNAKIHEK
jgi:hypothetical protein